MKPYISVITIGVNDLRMSVEFYQKLGFSTNGIIGEEHEYGAVAFFELNGGMKLTTCPTRIIIITKHLNLNEDSF